LQFPSEQRTIPIAAADEAVAAGFSPASPRTTR
jgi:hypothetical protein